MKRTVQLSVLMSLVLLAACSQSVNPTRPSPLATAPDGLFTQFAAARVVDWTSLTATRDDAAAIITADAPTAPANLAFTVSGSTVIFTWSAPSPGNATSYVLEAGTASGQSNIVSFNTGSTATTLTVTAVPNGTFFVRVRARNADGASSASNEVIILIGQGPCSPPSAPTGLTSSSGGSTVALSWTAVAGATAYIIEAGSAPGAANLASFDTGSAATSFSAAAPSGTYYIRVRARTTCGTSGTSNEVIVVVGTSGPPPSPVTGRWVGVNPEGMIADPGQPECPVEWDLEMNLSVSGTAVSGTATTRNRRVQFSTCGDVFGFVANYSVSGTVDANGAISFVFGTGGSAFTFSGTVSTTRMSGRFVGPNAQRGSFAVTRQ